MNISNYDDIWRLLSENTFEVDPDSINEDLSCIICNKLMIDACNGSCGCRYCYKCINGYLMEGDKYCPGHKRECKEQYLVMERDVLRNARLSNKISKLRVVCPNESCQFKIQLTQMREHLRLCRSQSMTCPYTSIGCDNGEETKDKVLAHLTNDGLTHSQLLIECLNNLRNEVNGLKDKFEMSKLEIKTLREESITKETQLREIMTEVRQQKREIECLKEESVDKENRIVTLEEKLGEVRNEIEMTMKREMERVMNDLKTEKDNMTIELCAMHKEINEMKVKPDGFKDDRERRMINLIKLCPNINNDFLWRIDGFREKMESVRDRNIYSEPFYANNYKLCVSLWIGKGDIYLRCYIMRGDNDDIVEWPMRRAVTISIIDQLTLGAHKAVTFKYETYEDNKRAFDRPTNDMNKFGIGEYFSSSFIKNSSLKDMPYIMVNNSIVLSCSISD